MSTIDTIEKISADVVIASCGAYGAPILDHIKQRFQNITCIHYGHHEYLFWC